MQLRSAHLAAQNSEGAPRSISSVRRENKAAGRPSQAGLVDERPKPHPCSPSALCDRHPSDLSVLVTWGAEDDVPGKVVTGHHQVINLSVCPDPAPRRLACPLALEIRAPAVVHHDFEADPVCMVPVAAIVSNQLFEDDPGSTLGLTLEVARESCDQTSGSSVTWLGPVVLTVERLASSQSSGLDLCACVAGPGVYELNHFGARLRDGRYFSFPVQALLTVIAL